MKLKINFLVINLLNSIVFAEDAPDIPKINLDNSLSITSSLWRHLKIYINGGINEHCTHDSEINEDSPYDERLRYVISELMFKNEDSYQFLVENEDLYEDGVDFAYSFAQNYFGELITKSEYKMLNENGEEFWGKIYSIYRSAILKTD